MKCNPTVDNNVDGQAESLPKGNLEINRKKPEVDS